MHLDKSPTKATSSPHQRDSWHFGSLSSCWRKSQETFLFTKRFDNLKSQTVSWPAIVRFKFLPPPPNPEFLTKDFSPANRSWMVIFAKENLLRVKNCCHRSFQDFHFLSLENQVFLVRSLPSDAGSESKISKLGGWGWKDDPDADWIPAKRPDNKEF